METPRPSGSASQPCGLEEQAPGREEECQTLREAAGSAAQIALRTSINGYEVAENLRTIRATLPQTRCPRCPLTGLVDWINAELRGTAL